MTRTIQLTSADGHEFSAYCADPDIASATAVVVIQEIFGVNAHIRSVCDRIAALGHTAVAPALFDRVERGFESGYTEADVAAARTYVPRVATGDMLTDVEAAVRMLRDEGKSVAVIGFCLGGSLAFLAAQQMLGLAGAIGYYGGRIAAASGTAPACPTQLHFGALDESIPLADVAAIEAARPDCDVHLYAGGGHGFHCDARAAYHAPSASRAWTRSTAFLAACFA